MTSTAKPVEPLHRQILTALEQLGGRGTLGDIAARAALPSSQLEPAMLAALSHVGGHLAVDEHGTIIYAIDRRADLPRPPRFQRLLRAIVLTLQTLFFAALSVVLVAYFIIYVVLLIVLAITACAAAAKGSDCDCDCNCTGCGKACDGPSGSSSGSDCCSCNSCGDRTYATVVAHDDTKLQERRQLREEQRARRQQKRQTRAERRRERTDRLRSMLFGLRHRVGLRNAPAYLGMHLEPEVLEENPPFGRAVHAFIFGPRRAPPDPRATERDLIGFIRAHDGRITATDAVMVTGYGRAVADRMLLDLAVAHAGDVEVSDEGAIVYTFDRFMTSTGWDLDEAADWLLASEGRVTLAMVAKRWNLSPADALGQLGAIQAAIGGEIIAHPETMLKVPPEDLADLSRRQRVHAELRDFHFAWERLATEPAIVGVPDGKRGWIYGFNTLNIIVSTCLLLYYGAGGQVLENSWETLWLGWLPALFSWSVFVIPCVRAFFRSFGNRHRLRDNARRIMLLALSYRLQQQRTVTAPELRADLGLEPESDAAIEAHLKRMLGELDGTIDTDAATTDPNAPVTYRFDTAYRELMAVEHARDGIDPKNFRIQTIAYDTAQPLP
jgi:hypothetical protein